MSDYYFVIVVIACVSLVLNVLLFFVGWQSERDLIEVQSEYELYRGITMDRLEQLHDQMEWQYETEVDALNANYGNLKEGIDNIIDDLDNLDEEETDC